MVKRTQWDTRVVWEACIYARRALSTVIGFTLSGRIDKRYFEHAICGDDIALTLRHFQHYIPGRFIDQTEATMPTWGLRRLTAYLPRKGKLKPAQGG